MNFKSTILSSAIIFALAGCGSSNDEAETTPRKQVIKPLLA